MERNEELEALIAHLRTHKATESEIFVASTHSRMIVRAAAAEAPNAPNAALENALCDTSTLVQTAAARNSNLSARQLTAASRHSDWLVRRAVAQNLSLSAALLGSLANDVDSGVRISVARHPSTRSGTLISLSGDEDVSVRQTVATLRATPLEALLTMVESDSDVGVRAAAAGNVSIPNDIRNWLINGWTPATARRALECDLSAVAVESIEAFVVLAELGMSPQEATWRSMD